jgi:hypothetical protein
MKNQFLSLLILSASIAVAPHVWADCNTSVSKKWNVGRSLPYAVDASSLGPDCKRAVALLVVRDGKGEVKYSFSAAAKDIGTFGNLAEAPVTDAKKMRAALTEWIDTGLSSKINHLSQYPEWKDGAEGPAETPPAEFPFTASSDLTRDTYENWRKQNLPVFCFVQGIESERCLVLAKDGSVSEVGIQSFPG